jgi:hypothetical protein
MAKFSFLIIFVWMGKIHKDFDKKRYVNENWQNENRQIGQTGQQYK